MSFKKGDKVMFLGVLEKTAYYAYLVTEDSLVLMKIYTVKQKAQKSDKIKLRGKLYWHPSRFFQKVEEDYEV